MTDVLLLTDTDDEPDLILPALSLLRQNVRVSRAGTSSLDGLARAHILLVDGRGDLSGARSTCRLLRSTAPSQAVLAVVTEGGMAGVSGDWQVDGVLATTATPAEVEMRLRLAQTGQASDDSGPADRVIEHGALRIDPTMRTVTVSGEEIGLTYQEFQLLACLAQHPGRVFHRGELLARLWGQEYAGGPRTVDVHIRRLRVALGDGHNIGTVRRVGYTFLRAPSVTLPSTAPRLAGVPDYLTA